MTLLLHGPFPPRHSRFRRKTALRALCSMALLAVLSFAMTSCGGGSSCAVDTWRCDGTELQYCTGHPGGPSGGIGNPHYHEGSSATWSNKAACSPGVCRVSGVHGSCTLEPKRNPACPAGAEAFACDGTTELDCFDGYVAERKACRACDPVNQTCEGSVHATCQVDADCAAGLTCDSGSCEMACTCPDGTACPACEVLDSAAFGWDRPVPKWTCQAQRCLAGY